MSAGLDGTCMMVSLLHDPPGAADTFVAVLKHYCEEVANCTSIMIESPTGAVRDINHCDAAPLVNFIFNGLYMF